mgnify:CR=1 FL=1
MKINIKNLSLLNQKLKKNSSNQRASEFYKRVRDSISEKGIINPLLVLQEGDNYKVVVGQNRYLAALELGIKEISVIVVPSKDKLILNKHTAGYKKF